MSRTSGSSRSSCAVTSTGDRLARWTVSRNRTAVPVQLVAGRGTCRFAAPFGPDGQARCPQRRERIGGGRCAAGRRTPGSRARAGRSGRTSRSRRGTCVGRRRAHSRGAWRVAPVVPTPMLKPGRASGPREKSITAISSHSVPSRYADSAFAAGRTGKNVQNGTEPVTIVRHGSSTMKELTSSRRSRVELECSTRSRTCPLRLRRATVDRRIKSR